MTEMRTSDIAYVPQGTTYMKPVPALKDMSLQEVTKRYLTTCVKSHGLVSECQRCTDKCAYGMRALALTFGEKTFADIVPYEGSLLQKARMENEKRRMGLTEETTEPEQKTETTEVEIEVKKEKKRRKNQDPEGWYEEAMQADDPVQYVMERFGKSKTQAKKKLYMYRYRYFKDDRKSEEEADQENTSLVAEDRNESEEAKPEECQTNETSAVDTEASNSEMNPVKQKKMESLDDIYMTKVMERKLEKLMNQQEEYESVIKEYQIKLAKVKEQIDTICKTMDILKELS